MLTLNQHEFLHTAKNIVLEGRQEKGNIDYRLQKDLLEDDLFSLMSEWENQHFLNQYIESQNFSVLIGAVNVLSASTEIRIQNLSNQESLERIKAIRNK